MLSFYSDLNKFNNLNQQAESTKEKTVSVYDSVSELYNKYLGIYFDQYMTLSDAREKNLGNKHNPINSFLETYNYNWWFENGESYNTTSRKSDKEESIDLSHMSPQEGVEEEVKQGKELKTLTPNKLLTRFPILLAQMKAGNNSCKLKIETRQILYLSYQHNKITKNVYNNYIKSL